MTHQLSTRAEPSEAESIHADGLRMAAAGRISEAAELFQQAVELNPNQPAWQFNMALAWQQLKRPDKAIAAYQKALAEAPDLFDAWNNLSAAWKEIGEVDNAIWAAENALRLRPKSSSAHLTLGNSLKAKGDWAGAESAYRSALEFDASCFFGHMNLAGVLQHQGNVLEAIQHAESAVRIAPRNADVHNNFGVLLQSQNRTEEAITSYRRALALSPNRPDFWTNLAKASVHLLQIEDADRAYSQALECDPEFAEAHYGRGWIRLLTGDYSQGWPEYEWRLRLKKGLAPHSRFQRWQGEELAGQTILIHCEQGLGDTIQFARYLRMVADRGGEVILECPLALKRLLQLMPVKLRVVAEGEALPKVDAQIPLLSLPLIFGTTLETIPDQIPYLAAPKEIVIPTSDADSKKLKIGLIWSGSCSQTPERRPIPFQQLAPLLNIQEAACYSLQVGPRAKDIECAGMNSKVVDISPRLIDFAITAAAIEQLDLVISIDTSGAHLAGALGKPVWLLLPFASDWRWMLDRDDCPWYPTMRLFRQKKAGDWPEVIERVVREIRILLTER